MATLVGDGIFTNLGFLNNGHVNVNVDRPKWPGWTHDFWSLRNYYSFISSDSDFVIQNFCSCRGLQNGGFTYYI